MFEDFHKTTTCGINNEHFSLYSTDHLLQELLEYCFFVRVWYDTSTFAVFKSNSVMIYSKPPLPVTILGKTVSTDDNYFYSHFTK